MAPIRPGNSGQKQEGIVNRARVLQWKRDMEAERQTEALRRHRNDTEGSAYSAKVEPGHPDYKVKVAEPTMEAVDGLPAEWRAILREHGYVDVFRAFKRRWPPSRVKEQAERNGGLFVL